MTLLRWPQFSDGCFFRLKDNFQHSILWYTTYAAKIFSSLNYTSENCPLFTKPLLPQLVAAKLHEFQHDKVCYNDNIGYLCAVNTTQQSLSKCGSWLLNSVYRTNGNNSKLEQLLDNDYLSCCWYQKLAYNFFNIG